MPILLLLLVAVAVDARDRASLRCDRQFIRVGDAKYQVLEACGEPRFRDRVSGSAQSEREQWVYESEWSDFPRLVTFEDGRVKRIERLDD
jgi:hypothetical protein